MNYKDPYTIDCESEKITFIRVIRIALDYDGCIDFLSEDVKRRKIFYETSCLNISMNANCSGDDTKYDKEAHEVRVKKLSNEAKKSVEQEIAPWHQKLKEIIWKLVCDELSKGVTEEEKQQVYDDSTDIDLKKYEWQTKLAVEFVNGSTRQDHALDQMGNYRNKNGLIANELPKFVENIKDYLYKKEKEEFKQGDCEGQYSSAIFHSINGNYFTTASLCKKYNPLPSPSPSSSSSATVFGSKAQNIPNPVADASLERPFVDCNKLPQLINCVVEPTIHGHKPDMVCHIDDYYLECAVSSAERDKSKPNLIDSVKFLMSLPCAPSRFITVGFCSLDWSENPVAYNPVATEQKKWDRSLNSKMLHMANELAKIFFSENYPLTQNNFQLFLQELPELRRLFKEKLAKYASILNLQDKTLEESFKEEIAILDKTVKEKISALIRSDNEKSSGYLAGDSCGKEALKRKRAHGPGNSAAADSAAFTKHTLTKDLDPKKRNMGTDRLQSSNLFAPNAGVSAAADAVSPERSLRKF